MRLLLSEMLNILLFNVAILNILNFFSRLRAFLFINQVNYYRYAVIAARMLAPETGTCYSDSFVH